VSAGFFHSTVASGVHHVAGKTAVCAENDGRASLATRVLSDVTVGPEAEPTSRLCQDRAELYCRGTSDAQPTSVDIERLVHTACYVAFNAFEVTTLRRYRNVCIIIIKHQIYTAVAIRCSLG